MGGMLVNVNPTTEESKEQQGIQSIEIGLRLLKAIAAYGRPIKLRDLAANTGVSSAKAHRYLVSLLRTGLVRQDKQDSRYALGDFALELGLVALRSLDPVQLARPILQDLCDEIGETVALAVWGGRGATIVHTVDAGDAITVSLRIGAILPLTTSATGRNFAAFARIPALRKLLDEELQQAAQQGQIAITTLRRNLEKNLEEIRIRGLARATGSVTPGINGFSAPVFDHQGMMVAAITSLGALGNFDTEWDNRIATAVKKAASHLSKQLGYHNSLTRL